MSRNTRRHQWGWNMPFGVIAGLIALVLVAFSGPAVYSATPGNSGKGDGQSGAHGNKNGHDKQEKHGNSGGNNGQGNSGHNGNSNGHTSGNGGGNGHSNGGGQDNGNAGGNTSHGNGGGNGHQSGGSGNSGGDGKGDPAGNNGTIKIDGVDFDTAPNNEPHPDGCSIQVDFYGFDQGDLNATVTFADHSPTSDGGLTVTSGQGNPSSVFIGEDDASGGGSEAGLDAQETYTFAFTGDPHPKQGYHVKLTVNAPGSKGADTKHKVFWVNEECGSQPPPPAQCPDGSNPGDTDGDGDEDADDCSSTPPPPGGQCPDGTNPGDVDGDGAEDADDCEVLGPPPSSNPLGSVAVNCKGVVTVKLDNRKSTVDRDYYFEREMDATAAQAWKFTVPAGEVRITTRHGSTGDVFTLSTDDKGLGSVTVPAKCGDTPDNPDDVNSSTTPDVPTTVNSGLAPAITVVSHPSGVSLWGVMLGLGALLAGGAVMLRRRLG